jgi:hypothetical protein
MSPVIFALLGAGALSATSPLSLQPTVIGRAAHYTFDFRAVLGAGNTVRQHGDLNITLRSKRRATAYGDEGHESAIRSKGNGSIAIHVSHGDATAERPAAATRHPDGTIYGDSPTSSVVDLLHDYSSIAMLLPRSDASLRAASWEAVTTARISPVLRARVPMHVTYEALSRRDGTLHARGSVPVSFKFGETRMEATEFVSVDASFHDGVMTSSTFEGRERYHNPVYARTDVRYTWTIRRIAGS